MTKVDADGNESVRAQALDVWASQWCMLEETEQVQIKLKMEEIRAFPNGAHVGHRMIAYPFKRNSISGIDMPSKRNSINGIDMPMPTSCNRCHISLCKKLGRGIKLGAPGSLHH